MRTSNDNIISMPITNSICLIGYCVYVVVFVLFVFLFCVGVVVICFD